jgi:hypothetical protein
MSPHDKPIVHAAPIVDEWGIYDPDRAGLAAVFAKLDAKRSVPSRGDANALANYVRTGSPRRAEK